MKQMMKKCFVAGAIAFMATTTFAQASLKVATGSATGTYSRMFKEFSEVCKDQILQVEVPSAGSVDNMDKILGNDVNAAIVQTDVLFFRSRNEDLGGIKTLFSLYPEEVHVVTTSTSLIKEGGLAGLGAKPIQLQSVNDLAGRAVAAWGGSVVTAQVIRLQSEINFQVVEVSSFKEALAALQQGRVAAILMVGGQPMSDVASLGKEYKLLSFPEATMGKLKNVYVPAKLNYASMGQGGSGVQTIATEALFVTRAYKSAKYVESLGALRSCFRSNLEFLQEETGKHKKWASVNADNTGKWPYFELPVITSKKK